MIFNGVYLMNVQVLCSTMNGEVPLFFEKGKFPKKYLIINQCKNPSFYRDDFINFCESGLSKSRNRAIENSESEICLIADNDVYYSENSFEIVEKYFSLYKDADILTFMVKTPTGDLFKKYKNNFFWHNRLTISSVSSVEIAFKRSSIIDKEIVFDNSFGLGSIYPTGEEYIFLNDALKKGLKIGFVPEVIVHHPMESSGSDFRNIKLIISKGAMVRRVFGVFGIFICLYFSLRKYKKSDLKFMKFLKYICFGFFWRKL